MEDPTVITANSRKVKYRRTEQHPWGLIIAKDISDPRDEVILCRVVGTEAGLQWTQEGERGEGKE